MAQRKNRAPDLREKYDDICTYASGTDLLVVFGRIEGRGNATRVVWDPHEQSWTSFIDAADIAAADHLVLEAHYGEDDHSGQMGCINLGWIGDGIVHKLEIAEDWWHVAEWRAALDGLVEDSDESEHDTTPIVDMSKYERVLSTSAEMLARELTDCTKYVLPDVLKDPASIRNALHTLRASFWAGKGVNHFVNDPGLRLKIQRVEEMAKRNLQKEHDDRRREELLREREVLPLLTKECVLWAKKRGAKKLTKPQVKYFLQGTDWELSSLSEDALYHEVNFILVG